MLWVLPLINVLPCGKERLQIGTYWSEITRVKGLKLKLLVHSADLFLGGAKATRLSSNFRGRHL